MTYPPQLIDQSEDLNIFWSVLKYVFINIEHVKRLFPSNILKII